MSHRARCRRTCHDNNNNVFIDFDVSADSIFSVCHSRCKTVNKMNKLKSKTPFTVKKEENICSVCNKHSLRPRSFLLDGVVTHFCYKCVKSVPRGPLASGDWLDSGFFFRGQNILILLHLQTLKIRSFFVAKIAVKFSPVFGRYSFTQKRSTLKTSQNFRACYAWINRIRRNSGWNITTENTMKVQISHCRRHTQMTPHFHQKPKSRIISRNLKRIHCNWSHRSSSHNRVHRIHRAIYSWQIRTNAEPATIWRDGETPATADKWVLWTIRSRWQKYRLGAPH